MESIEQARADLSQRLFALGSRTASAPISQIASEIESIRRIAQAHGLYSAASVAHALEMALGRGERGALIDGWLAILRDAVGTERNDPQACNAYAAACSVRLTG